MHLTDANNMETPAHRPTLPTSVLQFGTSPPQSWLQSPPTQMPWGTSQPSLVRFTAEHNGGLNGTRYFPGGGMPSQTPSSFTHTVSTYTQSQSFMPTSFAPQPAPQPNAQTTYTQSPHQSFMAASFPPSTSAPQPIMQMPPTSPPNAGLKRKLDTADDAEMLRAVNKLHISERVLASHHHGGAHALSTPPGVRTIEEIEEGHRVLLSPELASMPAQPILPQPLIDKMRRPSMALVLWQPPNPRPLSIPAPQQEEEEEEEVRVRPDVDNNNSSTVDLNHLPSFGALEPLQPMAQDQDIDMEQL